MPLQTGDLWGWQGLLFLILDGLMQQLNMTDASDGTGLANTAVLYHAKRLMALYEADLPYEVGAVGGGGVRMLWASRGKRRAVRLMMQRRLDDAFVCLRSSSSSMSTCWLMLQPPRREMTSALPPCWSALVLLADARQERWDHRDSGPAACALRRGPCGPAAARLVQPSDRTPQDRPSHW